MQQCVIVIIENIRYILEETRVSVALLIDISKVFDRLLHDMLISKHNFLKLYVHLDTTYNSLSEVLFAVPEDSVLVRLLCRFVRRFHLCLT